MRRFKSGFTLVELLVVITIIGLLVGLLIPAVSMVRERGRQATCLANQKQIGIAILAYETSKNHLPGVMDQMTVTTATGGTATLQYSWVEAIFPYLEHADIWGYVSTGKTNAIAGIRVNTVICPDDPLMVDVTSANAQQLLSYGVNDQFFVDYRDYRNPAFRLTSPANTIAPFVGRSAVSPYFSSVGAAVVSNLKTQPYGGYPRGQTATSTQTVMLGERTFPDTTTAYSGQRAKNWYDPTWLTPTPWTAQQYWQALAFPYPTPPSSVLISPAVMASTHAATAGRPGTVVIVTYFDGHGAILPSDTQFP